MRKPKSIHSIKKGDTIEYLSTCERYWYQMVVVEGYSVCPYQHHGKIVARRHGFNYTITTRQFNFQGFRKLGA